MTNRLGIVADRSILSLLQANWVMGRAASCVWQNGNGEVDVLAQAEKVRDAMQQ